MLQMLLTSSEQRELQLDSKYKLSKNLIAAFVEQLDDDEQADDEDEALKNSDKIWRRVENINKKNGTFTCSFSLCNHTRWLFCVATWV